MKRLAVLTGAGVSQESGLSTFRTDNGYWDQYRVEDVADIGGWYRDPKTVLEFYNGYRKKIESLQPNKAHKIIAELEEYFDVTVITQNIDNFHERAGSSHVIHLHGLITQAKGIDDDEKVFDIGYNDLNIGDKSCSGAQLRPNIVWFGESVPMLDTAARAVNRSDILLVVGTSLVVYPAAGLVNYVEYGTPIYLVDPQKMNIGYGHYTQIQDIATKGMEAFKKMILEKESLVK